MLSRSRTINTVKEKATGSIQICFISLKTIISRTGWVEMTLNLTKLAITKQIQQTKKLSHNKMIWGLTPLTQYSSVEKEMSLLMATLAEKFRS